MPSNREPVEVSGTLVRQTENAILFRNAEDNETWLPKSCAELDTEAGHEWRDIDNEAAIDISVPLWLAEKEGLV